MIVIGIVWDLEFRGQASGFGRFVSPQSLSSGLRTRQLDRVSKRPGPVRGWAREPGQALTGAALNVVRPVLPVSWSFAHAVVKKLSAISLQLSVTSNQRFPKAESRWLKLTPFSRVVTDPTPLTR